MAYTAKVGEEVQIIISQADDGAAAYKNGKMFARANFHQSTSGEFIMQNSPANIRLEIWNVTGGWYGAKFALFIGGKKVDIFVVDEGPALPQAVAWDHEFVVNPA